MYSRSARPAIGPTNPALRCLPAFLAGIVLLVSATSGAAQSVPADSATANGTPPRWGHSSCTATIPQLSDGDISNPGVCFLAPLDPSYRVTFGFSPTNTQFMTGINIWANAGNHMNDHELRQLDIEVDYFDPVSNSTRTLALDNVNIGDTTSFNDPKFVSFGVDMGLYQVSEVRLDDMVGLSPTGRVVFREVQGVFVTRAVAPEVAIASSESGPVSDGATDTHGVEASGVPKTVTYTITNSGTGPLILNGEPSVSNQTNLLGPVTQGPLTSHSLAPGEVATFDVTYTPDMAGAFSFDIDVPTSDADIGIYDIAVSGTANDAPSITLTSTTSILDGLYAVTATFSEPVSGLELSDFTVINGAASGLSNPSPGVYTITVTPTDALLPVEVVLPANTVVDADGEPNTASNSLQLAAAGVFLAEQITAIEEIIVEETVKDLRNGIALNQRANRDARARLAKALRCRDVDQDERHSSQLQEEELRGCAATVARRAGPVFDGEFRVTEGSLSGAGTYFAETSSLDGTRRRIAFGELLFTRSEDGHTSAILNGRVAWESSLGDDALRGLFIGANATLSDIEDSYSGTRTGVGLNAGAYFVDQLDDNLYWDGFISVGVGRNTLRLGNETFDVDGDYSTKTLQFGLALTGEHELQNFVVRPELSVAYGIASIGNASVSLSDGAITSEDEISVSSIALGVVRFRPEFVFQSEPDNSSNVQNSFTIAPSVFCEAIRTSTEETDCGGGLDIGWSYLSGDGLSELLVQASREVVGGYSRDQFRISFEQRF